MKRLLTWGVMALTRIALTCVEVKPSLAIPFAESGDAGKLPTTAQVITGPTGTSISEITGALGFVGDVDMFALLIPNPALFSATAALGGRLSIRSSFSSILPGSVSAPTMTRLGCAPDFPSVLWLDPLASIISPFRTMTMTR